MTLHDHGGAAVMPTITALLKTDFEIEIDGQAYYLLVGVMDQAPYPTILGIDVPVLVDLLQNDRKIAEARMETRAQAKRDETCKQLLQDLPFGWGPKTRKSKRERRQNKVEGTEMVDCLNLMQMI